MLTASLGLALLVVPCFSGGSWLACFRSRCKLVATADPDLQDLGKGALRDYHIVNQSTLSASNINCKTKYQRIGNQIRSNHYFNWPGKRTVKSLPGGPHRDLQKERFFTLCHLLQAEKKSRHRYHSSCIARRLARSTCNRYCSFSTPFFPNVSVHVLHYDASVQALLLLYIVYMVH